MSGSPRDELEGLASGAGMWLIQWAVIIPGLFPTLAIGGLIAAPFVILGVILGAIAALPYGLFVLARGAVRVLGRKLGRPAAPPLVRSA